MYINMFLCVNFHVDFHVGERRLCSDQTPGMLGGGVKNLFFSVLVCPFSIFSRLSRFRSIFSQFILLVKVQTLGTAFGRTRNTKRRIASDSLVPPRVSQQLLAYDVWSASIYCLGMTFRRQPDGRSFRRRSQNLFAPTLTDYDREQTNDAFNFFNATNH